jgi:hypothetical protein
MSTRRLHDHLTTQDSLAQLALHARYIGRLQRAYETFLPPELANISRVLNVKQGVVIVSAPSGAVANRLRQVLPSLLTAVRESCSEVTEVRVKVQAHEGQQLPACLPRREVSQQARAKLAEGNAGLAPDSELRRALQKLIDRS